VTGGQDETIDASAAIADGKVYVPISRANGPELAALSLADGSLLWKVSYDSQTGSNDFGSPVVWDGKVYIGTSGSNGDPVVPLRGNVTALDAETGQQVFEALLVPPAENGAPVWSTPAIDTDTGTLFVGTGNAYSGTAGDQTDSIVAIDARTGDVLRHFQATANDVFTASNIAAGTGPDYDFGASPQLLTEADGRKLVGEGQKSGTYWAVDRATMAPVWSFTTGAGSPLGGILGSTAYDGTHVYGPDTPGGEQWALGLDGTPSWVSADGGPEHFASTSVANGVVYDNDQSEVLTARDAATGAILAKVPLGGQSFGGVAIAGGYVFAAVGTQTASGSIVGYRADPPAAATRASRVRAVLRSARAAR
jgi:polyvinyl alcohol dehydrogenase (cytochrome)